MNRSANETLAVVVALTDSATPRLEASLARFAEEVGPLGEVWLVDGSGHPSGEVLSRRFSNVRVIRSPAGRLAPELWRDGLLATDAAFVAFSTAQMIPQNGWLASLKSKLIESGASGVGGPIEPGPGLSATDRAVALLRYAGYFPSPARPVPSRTAGDNALYRRDRLMKVQQSWLGGFWEVDVHKALRDRGESLVMSEASVTFLGGVTLRSMARQRVAHARRYGSGRSSGLSLSARLARIAASPLVPFVISGRIVKALKVRGMTLMPWLPAWPSLMVLASAWALGEAIGTWRKSMDLSPSNESAINETAPPATDPASTDRSSVPVTQLANEGGRLK